LDARTLHIRYSFLGYRPSIAARLALMVRKPLLGLIGDDASARFEHAVSDLGSSGDSGVMPRIHRRVATVKCRQTTRELHLALAGAVDDGGLASTNAYKHTLNADLLAFLRS
jgi:hypothetical protein